MSDVRGSLDKALGTDDNVPEETVEESNIAEETPEDTDETEEEDIEGGGEETSDDDDVDDEEVTTDDDEEAPKKATAPKEPGKIATIKAKYPNLFKEYPELKDALFKVSKYEQVAATPEIAANAIEEAQLLGELASELKTGNIEPILDLVYNDDPNALKSLVNNFLPTINKKAPKLFRSIIDPVFINFFNSVYNAGKKNQDKNLMLAAQYCNRFMFNDVEIADPVKVEAKINKNEEVDSARNSVAHQAEANFYSRCEDITDPEIDAAIMEGLDPENVLPKGLARVAAKKIKSRVYKKLQADTSHMRTMQALRVAAAKSNYDKAHLNKIARRVVRATKELIPSVRARVKKEMLGSLLDKNNTGEPNIPEGNGKGTTHGSNARKERFDPKDVATGKISLREAMDKV